MELRDLNYFCLAAEMQHITKAAEYLGVAQPFLTKIIKQLEDEIGGELFEKTGRGVKLNQSGLVFYKNAKKALADMNRLYSEMDYVFEKKERTITFLSNTEAFFSKLIDAFKKAETGYTLSISHAAEEAIVSSLSRGEADFALCCPPIDESKAFNIVTERIFYEIGCVFLPPEHRLIGREIITLDELRGDPLITMPPKSAMRYKLQPIFDKYGFHPDVVLETHNNELIIQAVNSGWGYAFLTTLIMDGHPEYLDRCVAVNIPENRGYFGLSYNALIIDERNAKHFRDFIRDFLRELRLHLYGSEQI